MLSKERAEKLAQYLTADIERAKKLLDMSPEDVVAQMKAEGYDFTVEEVMEFGEQLKHVPTASVKDGELSEEALSEVAGGVFVIDDAILGAGIALFCAGLTFGYTVARDRGW